MIHNNDIKTAVEAAGLRYVLTANAAELETKIHRIFDEEGVQDICVNFCDTKGDFITGAVDGRVYERKLVTLIIYTRYNFEHSRDAEVEGVSIDEFFGRAKRKAWNVVHSLNESNKFESIRTAAYQTFPFETTDVASGLWFSFTLIERGGGCE